MARLNPKAVEKLIGLLTLPVGGGDDARPESSAQIIQSLSEEVGTLVFEDTGWYENYRPHAIEAALEGWFDSATAHELTSKAVGPESPAWQDFLTWCEHLVSGWRREESGGAEDEAAVLGIANPNYDTDRVPGTQFYQYVDGEYLYADTPDALEWLSQEERYAAAVHDEPADTPPPSPALSSAALPGSASSSTVIGFRNRTSDLPGTAFYRQLDDGAYVYAPTEYAEPTAWHPYEYWSAQAVKAAQLRVALEVLSTKLAFDVTQIAELLDVADLTTIVCEPPPDDGATDALANGIHAEDVTDTNSLFKNLDDIGFPRSGPLRDKTLELVDWLSGSDSGHTARAMAQCPKLVVYANAVGLDIQDPTVLAFLKKVVHASAEAVQSDTPWPPQSASG